MVLLAAPQVLRAQHHGSHSGGAAGAPAGAPANDDLKDFNREVALQATTEQIAAFQQCTKTTAAAKKGAQDLLQLNAQDDVEVLHRSNDLANALDDAQANNQRFVTSFTAAQKSGLKEFTKKLGKANAEVAKEGKALRASGHSQAVVEKLDKALSEVQVHQAALGKEMGIPPAQ
jgi:hypothetical protein